MSYIGKNKQVALYDAYSRAQVDGLLSPKLDEVDSLGGSGQTWQDMTASRMKNVEYTNSTGRPIQLSIFLEPGTNDDFNIYINGVKISGIGQLQDFAFLYYVIPNGSTYEVSTLTDIVVRHWAELR